MDKPQPTASEDSWHSGSHVDGVYCGFRGLKRVDPQTLVRECQGLGQVRSLGELVAALQEADARLRELELFRELKTEVSVKPSGNESDTGPCGLVDVTFIAEERKRECTVSGSVDQRGEASLDVKAVQPALLGGPLCATASMGTTVNQARELLLRLSTPRALGRCAGSIDLVQTSGDETQTAGYSEVVSQAMLRLRGSMLPWQFGKLDWSVSSACALRDLDARGSKDRLPCPEIQRVPLRSFKTSLQHSASWAWGPEPPEGALPLGARIRADLEWALPPGSARFLRGELRGEAAWPLRGMLLGHVSGAAGLLLPHGSSCPQDRFHLGGASGPSVLKGFAPRGAEPRGLCRPRVGSSGWAWRPGDALGGEALLSAFAAISAPLPSASSLGGSRLMLFAGAGALGGPRESWGAGSSIWRMSAGLGLTFPIAGLGCLELTFAHPLLARSEDILQRWQLGLRIQIPSA